jgi:hypothetical protein
MKEEREGRASPEGTLKNLIAVGFNQLHIEGRELKNLILAN